jgi:predicted metal-dependent peptidase
VVNDAIRPPPSTDDLLRDWFDAHGEEDYSMMKLHKRTFFEDDIDILIPGLHSEELGTIVWVFDTSISVTDDMLRDFAYKVNQFREQYQFDSIVIGCDAQIQTVLEFSRDEEIDLSDLKGGGGTDFRPPFEYVQNELFDEITGLVYFTDLYGSFPEHTPLYPVLWLVWGRCEKQAPFGETVKLEL